MARVFFRPISRQAVAAVALVAVTALTASGCQPRANGDPADPRVEPTAEPSVTATATPTTPSPQDLVYVAMGDSYTAAPLFPLRDHQVINSCLRSRKNYPALTARELGIEVKDVSCSGASTNHIFHKQRFPNHTKKPQLDALDDSVTLVTLGIGANDFRFFSRMMFTCLRLAKKDPDGAPCRDRNRTKKGRDRLERKLGNIRRNVAKVVRAINKRAPNARILLIGYPQLLPDRGTCKAKLPLATGDYDYTRELNVQLAAEVANGATKWGAEYVDMVEASQGHDICSDEPWVAGIRGDPKRAMGLHPYPAGQRAVAALILERLGVEPSEELTMTKAERDQLREKSGKKNKKSDKKKQKAEN